MWIQSRQFTRLALISLVSVCALAGAGYGAIQGYKNWKERRLIRQSREYFAHGEVRQAVLSAQQAVANNPNSVAVCRLMAYVGEQLGSPISVYYRQRVAELQPATTNQLEVLKSATRFNAFAAAEKSLTQLTNSATPPTAEIKRAIADLYLAMRRLPEADTNFGEAIKLAPKDATLQLDLASLRLQFGSPEQARLAREQLQTLISDNTVKTAALRLLAEDALRHSQKTDCFKYTDELLANSHAFQDRLLRLRAVAIFQPELLNTSLSNLQKECGQDPLQLQSLASWMLNNNRTRQAADWLSTKPPSLLKQQPLVTTYCETLAMLEDWSTLQPIIQNSNWGKRESFRLALLARTLRVSGNELGSKVEWRKALKAASLDLDQHLQLVRLTSLWHWNSEEQEVLWQVVNTWPREKWAFMALSKILATNGNTSGLQALYAKVALSEPDNLAIRNNYIMVSLLLNPNDRNIHQKALELYHANSKSPVVASTYAFSLLLQKQSREALAIFQQLTPQTLKDPTIAVYFGLTLNACGHTQDARPLLESADKTVLLPEEKQLVNRALSKG